jgi:hypothetical protein
MTDELWLISLLVTWALTISYIVYQQLRHRVIDSGLIFAYLFQLSLIHLVGATVHVFPWYIYPATGSAIVAAGFEQATYGILALLFGLRFLTPVVFRLVNYSPPQPKISILDPRLPSIYLIIGFLSYFVLFPFSQNIPTLSAVTAAMNQLMLVGMCLGLWQSWHTRRLAVFAGWLALSAILPLLTIVSQGFLSYGVAAFATILAFMSAFVHPRWRLVLAGVLMTYIGLSFYVSYFRDRASLRAIIWGGLPLADRISGVVNTLQSIEPFNPLDQNHLIRIDNRLNQNYLVGAAVVNLQAGGIEYANGATLWEAVLALIPRALWPDKPIVAGSGDIVTQYTGIPFARNTSVGVGQVMEFYINFGTTGVVIGFLAVGCVVGVLDYVAGQKLRQGDWEGMVLWYLPGLALLQTGGSLVEVTSTAAASIVAVVIVNKLVLPLLRERQITHYVTDPHSDQEFL